MTESTGVVTLAEYAQMRGLREPALYQRVRAGMPLVGEFINPKLADEWWEARRRADAASKSARMKARYAADPEFRAKAAERMKAFSADPIKLAARVKARAARNPARPMASRAAYFAERHRRLKALGPDAT